MPRLLACVSNRFRKRRRLQFAETRRCIIAAGWTLEFHRRVTQLAIQILKEKMNLPAKQIIINTSQYFRWLTKLDARIPVNQERHSSENQNFNALISAQQGEARPRKRIIAGSKNPPETPRKNRAIPKLAYPKFLPWWNPAF